MYRPCFLVIDREFPSSISTRKLVIETAKFNVVTAYSGREALTTIERFPQVDGVVVDSSVEDVSCTEIINFIKQRQPKLPVIVIDAVDGHRCEGGDFHLKSFDPAALLEILTKLFPEAAKAVGAGNQVSLDAQNPR